MSLPSLAQAADNTRVQWESLLPPTEAGLSSTSGLIFVNRTLFSPLCIRPDSLSTALYRSAFSSPHRKCWRCVIHSPVCAQIVTWNHRVCHQIDGSTGIIGPQGATSRNQKMRWKAVTHVTVLVSHLGTLTFMIHWFVTVSMIPPFHLHITTDRPRMELHSFGCQSAPSPDNMPC